MPEKLPHPERPENDKLVNVIERVIDTCRDGEDGYRDAAEHITDAGLSTFFAEQSLQRAHFARQLTEELERQGRWQTTREGSVGGSIRRAWFDVKRTLGGGDIAILEAVEAGEDAARDAYTKALQEEADVPASVQALLRTQAQTVFAAHDHVKILRDRYKAA
jgi:uncharacterized protein (TIGR02284 family)